MMNLQHNPAIRCEQFLSLRHLFPFDEDKVRITIPGSIGSRVLVALLTIAKGD